MHEWWEKLLQKAVEKKDRLVGRMNALLLKLSGEDEERVEQLKTWLIGATVFVAVVGLLFGISAIVNWINQEPPHVHNWNEANCVQAKVCADCGSTEGEPLGHQYTSKVTDSTCTQQGYTAHTCSRCGDLYLTDFVETGHTWVDSTCETAKMCLRCSETVGEPLGHTWVDATCEDEKVCTLCSKTDGEPLGHDYVVVVTDPTYDTKGYSTYTCSRCDDHYVGDYAEILKRQYESGTLAFYKDGVAYLFGDDGEVTRRYTGWATQSYNPRRPTPWHNYRDSITKVVIEDGVSPASTDYWFLDCDRLTSVTIGDSITCIGNSTFDGCVSLVSIAIPDNVISIDQWAFQDCEGLIAVTFGTDSQLESIGDGAFFNCHQLNDFQIPDTITRVGINAFSCWALYSIFGNGLYLGNDNNPYLVLVDLDYGVVECTVHADTKIIASQAFGSGELESVAFLGKPVKFDDLTFKGLTTTVYYPQDVEGWINDVLQNYGGMLSWVPYTKADIKHGYGTLVFCSDGVAYLYGYYGNAIETYTGWDVATYSSREDVPWYKDRDKITSVIIEDGVAPASTNWWFSLHTKLTDVSIGNGVTSIGWHAFELCTRLQSVTFADGGQLTHIQDYAFTRCDNLREIAFGANSSLLSIGYGAFSYCSNLQKITIPESVNWISTAFFDCNNLSNITFTGTVEQWNTMKKSGVWSSDIPAIEVICSDGTVKLD